MNQMDVAMDPMAGTALSLSARGRSARRKGQSFERTVANLLSDATGVIWKRKVRQHGNDSDVVTDDPMFQRLSIECKHAKTLCLPKWWRQAQDQAGDKIPMLIYRRDGEQIKVMVDANHVHRCTFPVAGRFTVTMEWEAAMQWVRETIGVVYSNE